MCPSVTLVELVPDKTKNYYCWFCGGYAERGTKHAHYSTLEGFIRDVDQKRSSPQKLARERAK